MEDMGVCCMDTREQMRTDLEAMLAAGRELSADTDRYLAEQFLDRHGARRALQAHLPVSVRRLPRRVAGLVLGLILAISVPLAIHAYTNPSVTICVPTIVKTYPSEALARSDAPTCERRATSIQANTFGITEA